MALSNCSRCGRLFNKLHRDICPKCYEEEEQLLRETQAYLREHRNAALYEIIEDLEIEEWLLQKWINEKRINLVTNQELMNKQTCIECGRELKKNETGSICKTCQLKKLMKKKTSGAESPSLKKQESEQTDPSKGMHLKKK